MQLIESENVELKSTMANDICKEVVAFANTNGGDLYIGVADNGEIIGVDNADQVILQLNNKIRDSIKPDVTMFVRYKTLVMDGKQIVNCTIQKGTSRPYYLVSKGLKPSGVFVRNGTSCDPATDSSIRMMIKESDGDSFEMMRSLEQALTFDIATTQFAKRKVPFGANEMRTLGLRTADGVYTNVAFLLSDQCGNTIKAATFSGLDKNSFQDRREFSGSLFKQMEEVYSYLELRNETNATFEGLYRLDTRNYPEVALREALLNCLIHRDYSYSAPTLISVYDDRIEFVSFGGLPAGVDLDDIMLGLSICRNPLLASVFYRLKLIEAYGTGIPKIIDAYRNYTVKPKIEVTSNAFKITLPNCNYQNISYVADSDNYYENRVLDLIKEKGKVVRSDIDSLLDVSQTTASRILKQMKEKGQIVQEGRGKSIRYKNR